MNKNKRGRRPQAPKRHNRYDGKMVDRGIIRKEDRTLFAVNREVF